MTETIRFPDDKSTVSFLRNGRVNTTGISIEPKSHRSVITLEAMNSRGNTATGCIDIPDDAETLHEIMQAFKRLYIEARDREDAASGRAGRRAWVDAADNVDLCREGDLEVDGDALVSEGDDSGCYVQAWVWVSQADALPDQKTKLNLEAALAEASANPDQSIFTTQIQVWYDEDGALSELTVVTCAATPEDAGDKALAWVRANVPLGGGVEIEIADDPVILPPDQITGQAA